MSRFISWLTVGIAAAFLVVVSTSFSPAATAWLAFAVSIGTLGVSAGIAYRYRHDLSSVMLGLVTSLVSGWTIVASLVFSQTTAQSLALAGSIAISALAVAGLTAHELERDHAVSAAQSEDHARQHDARLSAAA
jgi:FtsH-binding integral membrane protein